MSCIYDQHSKAFSHVSSYAIMHRGKPCGVINIKYPKDGAGRLTMFLHLHGSKMVKGTASGYGYDKATAAFYDCAIELEKYLVSGEFDEWANMNTRFKAFINAASKKFEGLSFDDAIDKQRGFHLIRTL